MNLISAYMSNISSKFKSSPSSSAGSEKIWVEILEKEALGAKAVTEEAIMQAKEVTTAIFILVRV